MPAVELARLHRVTCGLTGKMIQRALSRRATVWSKAGGNSALEGCRVGGSIAVEEAELGCDLTHFYSERSSPSIFWQTLVGRVWEE